MSLKKLSFLFTVLLALSISFSATAANLGPAVQKMPNWTFQVLPNGTNPKAEPTFLPVAKLRKKAIAIIYWKVGDSKSETELKAFENVAKLKNFKGKVQFFSAVKTTSDADKKKAIARARKLGLTLPMILDRNQVGPYLYAWYSFPKYGIIDAKGYLKIKNCNSLSETVGPRTTFLSALKLAAEGKNVPHFIGIGKTNNSHELVDKSVPDVGLDDENGKNKTVKQFLRKKPTLVVFWSATCDHCRKVVPIVAKYWRSRQGNLDMLTITRAPSQELKNEIKKLFKEKGVTFPVAYAPENATLSFFKIVKVPTIFLLDKNGKVIHTWIQPDGSWIAKALEASLFEYKLF